MENSDMPAMPIKVALAGGTSIKTGLTKREMFAMHAMGAYINGQLSWTNGVDGVSNPSYKEVAEESVAYADAVLKELDKGE